MLLKALQELRQFIVIPKTVTNIGCKCFLLLKCVEEFQHLQNTVQIVLLKALGRFERFYSHRKNITNNITNIGCQCFIMLKCVSPNTSKNKVQAVLLKALEHHRIFRTENSSALLEK